MSTPASEDGCSRSVKRRRPIDSDSPSVIAEPPPDNPPSSDHTTPKCSSTDDISWQPQEVMSDFLHKCSVALDSIKLCIFRESGNKICFSKGDQTLVRDSICDIYGYLAHIAHAYHSLIHKNLQLKLQLTIVLAKHEGRWAWMRSSHGRSCDCCPPMAFITVSFLKPSSLALVFGVLLREFLVQFQYILNSMEESNSINSSLMSEPDRKRQVFHRQAREIIFKVHEYFKREADAGRTLCDVAKVQERTAEACGGIAVRTVGRIVSEARKSVSKCDRVLFSSPGKKRCYSKRVTKLDEFDKSVLRRKILEMYDRGEYSTAKKIVVEMRNAVGYSGSTRSMYRILKDIGFKYVKCNDGRKFLLERGDIASARVAFLRIMNDIRKDRNTTVYYMDETWVNQNHSLKYCWQTSEGEGGLRVPVGKGPRIVICHAGSEATGFVPQAKMVFRAKSKNADYHSEMNAVTFRMWFVEMFLPFLKPNSVIVMDNAPYHSMLLEKCPTSSTKKADIIEWLTVKRIPHSTNLTRSELLQIARDNKPKNKKYELDCIAETYGHRVIRIPPYHCQYNPIELIWAQVKRFVAENNTSFKIADTERLVHEAMDRIGSDEWMKCVKHTDKLQEEDFAREIVRDEILEPILINVGEGSASSDSDSSDDEFYGE